MSDDVGALMRAAVRRHLGLPQGGGHRGADRAPVTGAGPIGLLAMQVAKAFGATDVAVSDVNEQRLAFAERLGATRTLRAGRDVPGEVDAVIECSGQPAAIVAGLEALRPAGTAVLVGITPPTIEFPVLLMRDRALWVTGTYRYANTYPTAIELAATDRVDVAAIITGHYALDDQGPCAPGAGPRQRQGHGPSAHDGLTPATAPSRSAPRARAALVGGGRRSLTEAELRRSGRARRRPRGVGSAPMGEWRVVVRRPGGVEKTRHATLGAALAALEARLDTLAAGTDRGDERSLGRTVPAAEVVAARGELRSAPAAPGGGRRPGSTSTPTARRPRGRGASSAGRSRSGRARPPTRRSRGCSGPERATSGRAAGKVSSMPARTDSEACTSPSPAARGGSARRQRRGCAVRAPA